MKERKMVVGGMPRYAEIRHAIETRIMSGDWPPGTRLPPELELADRFGCSRMTVNKALSALAAAGLIVRRRRLGSFVATPKSQETVLEIHDIPEEIRALGLPYRHELLTRRTTAAASEAQERLGLGAPGPVFAVTVRHFAAAQPFVIEDRVINLEAVPEAAVEPFAATPPGTWLLGHIPWTEAEHTIQAVAAAPAIAELLAVEPGDACLVIVRTTWRAGVPITNVRLTYPGNRHQLTARFRPSGLGRNG